MMCSSLQTSLYWIRKASYLSEHASKLTRLLKGMSKPKFTEWVKELILESLDHYVHKNLPLSTESFEKWVYSPNPNIDKDTYFAASLATWLSGADGPLVTP